MDKERLIELIKSAQGNRSQNQFALHTRISSGAITRFINGERKPTPDSLRRISQRAYNGVTYEQLMEAAGYIDSSPAVVDDPTLTIPENLRNVPVAFHGGMDGLEQEDIDEVSRFIEFVKSRKKK